MKDLYELLDKIEERIKHNKKDYYGEIYRTISVACVSWGNLESEEEKEQVKARLKEVIDLYKEKY